MIVLLLSILFTTNSTLANSSACNRNLTETFSNSDIETLANTNCSKLQRRNQEDYSCNCINDYNERYGIPTPSALSDESQSRFRAQAEAKIEKVFLALSTDIIAANSSPGLSNQDIWQRCNITRNLENKSCENSPTLIPNEFRESLALKMKNEVQNASLTNNFSDPSFLGDTRRSDQNCAIPDIDIYKITHETQILALAPLSEIFRNSPEAQTAESVYEGLSAIQRSSEAADVQKLEVMYEAIRQNPLIRNLLNSPEFMNQFRDSGFDADVARNELESEDNLAQTLESIQLKCDETFSNINEILCADSPSDFLENDFASFRLNSLDSRSPASDVDDLINTNQDIAYFCANRESISDNEVFETFNNLTPPYIQNADSAQTAAEQIYNYNVLARKYPQTTDGNADNESESIALCDFVPNPGNRERGKRKDIREAFRANCGQELDANFSMSQIEGEDPNKLFTYNCQTTLAVWKLYGDQIRALESLESAIQLAEGQEAETDEARTVSYNGSEIPLSQALELRESQIDNFFTNDSPLLSSFTRETREPVINLEVTEQTPRADTPATETPAATAATPSSDTPSSDSGPTVSATSSEGGNPTTTLQDSSARAFQGAGNFGIGNTSLDGRLSPAEVQANMNDFYSEFASRLRSRNDQDIQRMQDEVRELGAQVADRPQANTRERRSITPSIDTAIANAPARELFANTNFDELPRESTQPITNSGTQVADAEAPEDIPVNPREEFNDALNARQEALERAAAASGASTSGRAPAAIAGSGARGGATAGSGSLSITPPSENTTPLDAGNLLAQINIEDNANLDTALVNIAQENPEVARELLNILQNDRVRSFYISNNEYRVLINKRDGEFIVRSEGNEADPGYIKFLTSVRQSIQVQNNFEDLIAQLTRIN